MCKEVDVPEPEEKPVIKPTPMIEKPTAEKVSLAAYRQSPDPTWVVPDSNVPYPAIDPKKLNIKIVENSSDDEMSSGSHILDQICPEIVDNSIDEVIDHEPFPNS